MLNHFIKVKRFVFVFCYKNNLENFVFKEDKFILTQIKKSKTKTPYGVLMLYLVIWKLNIIFYFVILIYQNHFYEMIQE